MIKRQLYCDFCGKPIVTDKHDKGYNHTPKNTFSMIVKSPTGKKLQLDCTLSLQQVVGESQAETVLEHVDSKYSSQVILDEPESATNMANPMEQMMDAYMKSLMKKSIPEPRDQFHLCHKCHRGLLSLFVKSARYRTVVEF